MKRPLPYHGWCFVCGNENPHSIGLTWYVDDDGIMTSKFTLNEAQQGPPGHAHGGASAAILKPLPLNQPLTLEARITQMDERKIFSTGEIKLADLTVAVSGRGIYVVAPKLFETVNLE